MKRLISIFAGFCLLALAFALPAQAMRPAQGNFGVNGFDVAFSKADTSVETRAGAHPFAYTTFLNANLDGAEVPEGRIRDLFIAQIPGLVGDTTAYPSCTPLQFAELRGEVPNCPLDTAVGIISIRGDNPTPIGIPVWNITPPPGVLLRLGFVVVFSRITLDIRLNDEPPYNPVVTSRNTSQLLNFRGAITQIWGDPSDPGHDELRGVCGYGATVVPGNELIFKGSGDFCSVPPNPRPFLTTPTYCNEPLLTSYELFSWEGPSILDDGFDAGGVLTNDGSGDPQPFTDCASLAFKPSIEAQPTTKAAQSPTGLDFNLKVKDEGLTSVEGRAASMVRKVEVTLPEGMSANPSLAEGLEVCTEADLAAETLQTAPGEGCPQASKIGTVEVESPLVEEAVKGSLYIAEPYRNEFGSLLALYIVLRNPRLGIIVKQAAKVVPDLETGRLTTIAEEIPQLPFSAFRLHFREGARSPLASPPRCGSHEVKALLTPWSGGSPVTTTSSFQIISGPDEGPCPSGGLPPFRPGLTAGTLNNAAGAFSPFNLRLSRSDGEQEFTRFSIKLPPGIAGILAGIPKCPDAAIAAAKSRTGTEELANPSCPAASEVGRSLAGAGVGPSLTYAPGKIYLAGPFEGAPISIAAITAAKVGPFDLGTVVVRQGFKIDPRTAEVFLDPIGSDPIPHIIRGIVVHARDIRAYVDRPNFVFNPTSCEPTATASTLLGSGLDFVSPADDNPVVVSSRFQAADCAALKFNPKLNLRLLGGTKRGGHPKLRAQLRMRKGEANISYARVTLPRSAFLDQSHIRTVCTRVQFAQKACPAGSVYGYAKAITPILDAPIEGPVYLRSSEHKLPDLVGALESQEGIFFELVGRVDSLKGRIRNTFEIVPDAPVDRFTLTMQGGRKGLIVNSTDLCKGKAKRAIAEFRAHNGRRKSFRPAVKAKCGKRRGAKRSSHRRARLARASRAG